MCDRGASMYDKTVNLATLMAAEFKLSKGLESKYESFMHFHAREVLLIQAVVGYSKLIDDVMDNHYWFICIYMYLSPYPNLIIPIFQLVYCAWSGSGSVQVVDQTIIAQCLPTLITFCLPEVWGMVVGIVFPNFWRDRRLFAFKVESSSRLFPIMTLQAVRSIAHILRMSTKTMYNIYCIKIDAIAYILHFRTNRGLTDQTEVQYSTIDPLPWFSKLLTFWKELSVAPRLQPLKYEHNCIVFQTHLSKILHPYFSERAFQNRLALTVCLGDPLPVQAQYITWCCIVLIGLISWLLFQFSYTKCWLWNSAAAVTQCGSGKTMRWWNNMALMT